MENDPSIEEEAAAIRLETLPPKSRKEYFRNYDHFQDWRKKKTVAVVNKNSVLVYFKELSERYAPTSLWSKYSMVRSTLINKDDIDISKFLSLRQFLERQSAGYIKKKSKVFSEEEISKFISFASDCQYLAHKMVTVLGILGACRREEMYKLQITDFEESTTNVVVKIMQTKFDANRTFVIGGAYFHIYKKYVSLRPSQYNKNQIIDEISEWSV